MSQDSDIAKIFTTVLERLAHDELPPSGSIVKSILSSQQPDDVVQALESFVCAPGYAPALREIIRRAIAKYIWRLSIEIDERRQIDGVTLVCGLVVNGQCSMSGGSLHEEVVKYAEDNNASFA